MKLERSLWIFGTLAFFLALAPFYPEPHLFPKIKWVLGGANGMESMDWLDLFLHGGPILAFFLMLGFSIVKQQKAG